MCSPCHGLVHLSYGFTGLSHWRLPSPREKQGENRAVDLQNAALPVSTCSRGRGGLVWTLECYITSVTRLLVTFSARVIGGFRGLRPQKQEDPRKLWPPWFLSLTRHHVQTLAIRSACRWSLTKSWNHDSLCFWYVHLRWDFCVLTDLVACFTCSP